MLDRFRFGYSLVGQLLVMIVFITVGNGLFWTTAETTQAEEADFDGAKDQVRFRRPISIESTYLENRLLVANSTSGSISVIDSVNNVVVSEFDVVNKAAGFTADRSKRFFLLTDVDDGRLHCLKLLADGRLQAQWNSKTVNYCRSVKISPGNDLIAVAGHWSRQIEISKIKEWDSNPMSRRVIDLDFVPGRLCWIDNEDLLILGAFDGQMAVVNARTFTVNHRLVADHRFGGAALRPDGKSLLLTDQMLNPLAQSTRNDVFWGLMVANRVSQVPVEWLHETAQVDLLLKDYRAIGGPRNAKADPGAIWLSPQYTLVALAGVDQLGVALSDELEFAFVETGRRPLDVIGLGRQAFVVNMLDDSVTVIDLEKFEAIQTISLGQTPELTMAQQGERLFSDANLSLDGWMSCHSCHVEGHTNGQLNDNASDGSFGTPKRVISLLGRSGSAPFAWNGGSISLDDQVRKSIEVTMQSSHRVEEQTVSAITAFLQTLPAPPAINAARKREQVDRIHQGKRLFGSLNCTECHEPPHYSSRQNYDVGLSDENGLRTFNPPVLLGLSQRDYFFHDNRASSLADVVKKYRHQLDAPLSEEEVKNLLAFLNSL